MKIGSTEVNVQDMRHDWALALMTRGVIVDLRITRWRATSRLDPADLGLNYVDADSKNFMERYVHLGNEKLLPPEILDELGTLESRARKCLEQYSFKTVWGYFVPYSAFEAWHAKNLEIKGQLMTCANTLGSQYDNIIERVKQAYRNMAKDVWARLYPQEKEPTESFVTNFVDRIIAKIPPASEIVASFKYDTVFFNIPLPAIIQENIAQAEQTMRDREMAVFDDAVERQAKERISQEYVTRKTELIDGFLKTTVQSMRQYIGDLCDTIVQSINKTEKSDISKAQQDRILAMIDKVKLLNFYNDSDIQNALKSLQEEVIKVRGERDRTLVVAKLRYVIDAAKEEFVPSGNQTINSMEIT